jgi:hypothetical protein
MSLARLVITAVTVEGAQQERDGPGLRGCLGSGCKSWCTVSRPRARRRSHRDREDRRAIRGRSALMLRIGSCSVRPGCGLADRLAQRSSISNSEPCGTSNGPSVNSMEQLTECRSECCKSSRPANRAVKPTGCRILMPRPRVIPAGQPDQSQPRRRNSNTRKTPTMSSEVPARRI